MRGFGPEKRPRNREVTFGPAERSRADASSAVQVAEGALKHPKATSEYVSSMIAEARSAIDAVIERPNDPAFLPMLQGRLRAVIAQAEGRS